MAGLYLFFAAVSCFGLGNGYPNPVLPKSINVYIAVVETPVVGLSERRIQVFARGEDNQVYHKYQIEILKDIWTNWTKIPTPHPNITFAADPAVGVNPDGRIDLFIRYTTDLDLFQVSRYRHQS